MTAIDPGGRPRHLEIGVPIDYDYHRLREQHLARVTRHLDGGVGSLLDVGCGNGANTAQFARFVPRVVGVDVEPHRVKVARHYADEHGLDNLGYVVYDGSRLPFADGEFDCVTCFDVLEHVEDERAFLSELRRVLSPRGRLIISVPNKWYLMEVHGFRLHPTWLPWSRVPFLSWLPTPLHERYAHARIYSRRRIKGTLAAAGLQVRHHEYVPAPFDKVRRPGARRALRAVFDGLDRTPLRVLGLRHFLLAERAARG